MAHMGFFKVVQGLHSLLSGGSEGFRNGLSDV